MADRDLLNYEPEEAIGEWQPDPDFAEKQDAERANLYAMSDAMAVEVANSSQKFTEFLDMQSNQDLSANNTLLVLAQRPDAIMTKSATYWYDHRIYVKNEERENPIMIIERRSYFGQDNKRYYDDRPVKAYDLIQTEGGKKSPPPKIKDETKMTRALIANAPISIRAAEEGADFEYTYSPATQTLTVNSELDFSTRFRSLVEGFCLHELNGSDYGNEKAETATYIVCKRFGVEPLQIPEDSIEMFSDDPKEIKADLSEIRHVANSITDRVRNNLRELNAQEKESKKRI